MKLFSKLASAAAGIAAYAIMDANPSLFFYDAVIVKPQRQRLMHNRFQGKRIWITGASSGIGESLVEELYKNGAHIIASARRVDRLKDLADRCVNSDESNPNAGSINILPFDAMTSSKKYASITRKAVEFYGGIDILILNAGRTQRLPSSETTEESTRKLMELNFMAPVRLTLALMKIDGWKRKKSGHIVLTSSVAGKYAVPLSSSYAASKHALNGYFSSLRAENSSWMRVDIICPGPIATPIDQSAVKSIDQTERDSLESKMPVTRCVQLMLSSIAGPQRFFFETWIAKQPVLTFSFLNQYTPNICTTLINIFGNLRVAAYEQGLDLFKFSNLVYAGFANSPQSDQ